MPFTTKSEYTHWLNVVSAALILNKFSFGTDHEDALESGGIAPHICNHGTRWRREPSLMPPAILLLYPLDSMFGGPQILWGCSYKEPISVHAGK